MGTSNQLEKLMMSKIIQDWGCIVAAGLKVNLEFQTSQSNLKIFRLLGCSQFSVFLRWSNFAFRAFPIYIHSWALNSYYIDICDFQQAMLVYQRVASSEFSPLRGQSPYEFSRKRWPKKYRLLITLW